MYEFVYWIRFVYRVYPSADILILLFVEKFVYTYEIKINSNHICSWKWGKALKNFFQRCPQTGGSTPCPETSAKK